MAEQLAQGLSLARIREHQAALEAFRSAYWDYLEAGPSGAGTERTAAIQLIPAAHRAMAAVGMGIVVTSPPAMGGGVTHRGLANVAFLHETPGYRPIGEEGGATFQLVLDSVDQSIAYLVEYEKDLSRARRRPLYWVDRAIRALLSVPAYLVSVLFGVSRPKVEGSWLGVLLRCLAAVAEVFGILAAGRALGLW